MGQANTAAGGALSALYPCSMADTVKHGSLSLHPQPSTCKTCSPCSLLHYHDKSMFILPLQLNMNRAPALHSASRFTHEVRFPVLVLTLLLSSARPGLVLLDKPFFTAQHLLHVFATGRPPQGKNGYVNPL